MLIYVTRTIKLPDPVKPERYRHCPEIGPKVLFFSGGSALRQICSELIRYTCNSIHIITAFDSGGSSAKLRDAFKMPAIGDPGNRLLSLADRTLTTKEFLTELSNETGIPVSELSNPCPKIFIPNTGSSDPETYGLDLMGQVDRLLSYPGKDDPESISVPDVLNYLLIDEENGNYQGKVDREVLNRMGIEVINMPLVSPETRPYIDEKLAVPVILSLL